MTLPDHITPEAFEWAEIFMDAHRGVEDDRELLALAFMDFKRPSPKLPAKAYGLTPRQKDVYVYLRSSTAGDQISPTIEEIRQACSFGSKSSVARVLSALEERGLIRRLAHRSRSIALVGRAA